MIVISLWTWLSGYWYVFQHDSPSFYYKADPSYRVADVPWLLKICVLGFHPSLSESTKLYSNKDPSRLEEKNKSELQIPKENSLECW